MLPFSFALILCNVNLVMDKLFQVGDVSKDVPGVPKGFPKCGDFVP